ncbi:hypothetical protein P9112_013824 [Eukaryota sp. TZLM1-RC]
MEGLSSQLRNVFNTSRTRPLAFRKQQLLNLKQCITENETQFTDAIFTDLHRVPTESQLCELILTCREIDESISNLKSWNKPTNFKSPIAFFPTKQCATLPEPRGAVLIIAPWNYPFLLCFSPLISAIAAGCVVCLKPSEHSPSCSSLLATLLPKYLDPECFVVVEGGIEETQKLLSQPWGKIFFTGSTNVGKIVMKAASEHLTPVVIEAGGKSPTIITNTAPLELTCRRLAYGKCLNNGQTCVAPDYCLISEQRLEEFIKGFSEVLNNFYGDDIRNSTDYSRIINQKHAERIQKLVNDALDKGAQLVIGDVNDINIEEKFIPPLVLVCSDFSTMDIGHEEIFGPVLLVVPVKEEENMVGFSIDYVNNRPNPLALYIFSTNSAEINLIIGSTSSGGVCINDTVVHLGTSLPFGGVGLSGFGRSHGIAGFKEFVHEKPVFHRGTVVEADKGLRYPPYTESSSKWLQRMSRI